MHLATKRMRRQYEEYREFKDRIDGFLNAAITERKQFSITAQREVQDFRKTGLIDQSGMRNNADMSYKVSDENGNKLEFYGGSVWSTLTDAVNKDFRYIYGYTSASLSRNLRPDFGIDAKARLQISTFRDKLPDEMGKMETRTLETRKAGYGELSNIISPSSYVKLKIKFAGLYDSIYKGHFTPGGELSITPKFTEFAVGFRRNVILPDQDELYWTSKMVKVNDSIDSVDFWEAYSSLNINVISHLNLLADASYSRPKSRIAWEQLPDYVWTPVKIDTSQAIRGEAYLLLNLIGNFGTFAGAKYQYFDKQHYDPEITADAGLYYGRSITGSITLGGSFWNFQTLEDTKAPENIALVYLRIHRSIRRAVNIFIEGRYTIEGEEVIYYKGMPQTGRIVSLGINTVFGGLN